jgi:hypothetical protein
VTPLRSVAALDPAAFAAEATALAGALAGAALAALAVGVLLDVAAVFDAPAELHAASSVATTLTARTDMAGLDSVRTFVFPSGH